MITKAPINKFKLNSNCLEILKRLKRGSKVSLFTFTYIKNIHSRFYDIRKHLLETYNVELQSCWSDTQGTKHKTYWINKADLEVIKKGNKVKFELFSKDYMNSIGFEEVSNNKRFMFIYLPKIITKIYFDTYNKKFIVTDMSFFNIKTRKQLETLIKILK